MAQECSALSHSYWELPRCKILQVSESSQQLTPVGLRKSAQSKGSSTCNHRHTILVIHHGAGMQRSESLLLGTSTVQNLAGLGIQPATYSGRASKAAAHVTTGTRSWSFTMAQECSALSHSYWELPRDLCT